MYFCTFIFLLSIESQCGLWTLLKKIIDSEFQNFQLEAAFYSRTPLLRPCMSHQIMQKMMISILTTARSIRRFPHSHPSEMNYSSSNRTKTTQIYSLRPNVRESCAIASLKKPLNMYYVVKMSRNFPTYLFSSISATPDSIYPHELILSKSGGFVIMFENIIG